MEHSAVPPEIITLVQQLHHEAQYIYRSGTHRGATTTTNGIKQGCVIAPYLWNYYSLLFLLQLQHHRDTEWIRRILTLFADDIWGAWEIKQAADLTQAIHDISLVLETLESLSMTINYSKTAILLRLVGKDARQLKHEHTFMKAGQLHLRVQVHGRECGIPIKDHHEYLGTVVTYSRRHQRNMSHRIKACAARYQGLRKLLNGSHHLSEPHRLRLWQACVCTSAMYAQHVVGLSASSLHSLTTVLTKHLRAIMRLPAHLTHVSTADIWHRAGLPMPGWTIQLQQQQLLARLERRAQQAPDITTTPAALQHLRAQVSSLEAVLKDVAEGLAKTPQQSAHVSCPYCQESFVTEHAMRIHCSLQHKSIPRHSTKTPTVFQPALHSKAGMPACQLCDRQFWRWAHLVQHIEKGACRCLGGQSDILAPVPDGQEPAPIQQPPTAELDIFGEENVARKPLVTRRAFLEHLDTWERWLRIPAVRLGLRNHCALCHFWVADFRHMKQHLNRVHLKDKPTVLPRALDLCNSFKSQLRRGSSCIWCTHKVGAPGRHAEQCTPLVQLCIAVVSARDDQHVRGDSGVCEQRGGGGLRPMLGQSQRPSFPSGQSLAEAPSAGVPAAMAESQTIAAAVQATIWQSLRATATAAPTGSTSSSDPRGFTAGGGDQPAEAGQGLHALHEADRGGNPGLSHEGRERMAPAEVPGDLCGLPATDRSHVQHGERAAQASPTGGGHRGEQSPDDQGRVVDALRRVDLPDLVSHRAPSEARHQEDAAAPRRGGAAELPAGAPERRCHPTLRLHSPATQARAAGSPGGDVRPRNLAARPNGPGTVRQ